MTCPEFQEKADVLLDAEPIDARDELALETHLLSCSRCRFEFQLSRAIRDLYRARFHYTNTPSAAVEQVQRTLEREYSSLVSSGR